MEESLIYRTSIGYELVMLVLYRWHYAGRYQAVADLIPAGAEVMELCCGPGILYRRYLRHKGVQYLGLDVNEKFIRNLIRRGIAAERWDLRSDRPLPSAGYVIMQASLYHFLPDAGDMLARMVNAAREAVIIAEPIHNLTSSRWPVVAYLSGKLTDPGGATAGSRFVEKTLDELAERQGALLRQAFLAPGGREKIYFFEKNG